MNPRYTMFFALAVVLSGTSTSARAAILNYFTAAASPDSPTINATNNVPMTVLPDTGGDARFGFNFTYDTDLGQVVFIDAGLFGGGGIARPDIITAPIGNNRVRVLGNGSVAQVQFVLEGDLSLGGRIDIVPFDPDGVSAVGFTARKTPDLFVVGGENFGTMFLEAPNPFRRRGGPTASDLASIPPFEFFVYATPVPEPSTLSLLSLCLIAGLRRR